MCSGGRSDAPMWWAATLRQNVAVHHRAWGGRCNTFYVMDVPAQSCITCVFAVACKKSLTRRWVSTILYHMRVCCCV